ncbi:hypothetical protein CU669_20330 [Paramagnetospirillum kuznetsovii]|uniref:HD-GYP domain-containing protein n=1 Tax=Paramagnetospirillum kuznetsovii TaxID=2053833 RepID=A0A364NSJ5_9PROT|nr:hypothetical protein CU669_20330 [Paramagnetospirillum kuznetsovii]
MAAEREREIQAWQVRLGIVADSRLAAVTGWLDDNQKALRELTENASLQIYVTELTMAQGNRAKVTDEPAQAGYLRNLLNAVASRSGFAVAAQSAEVPANVERIGSAGIAILDSGLHIVVASGGTPPITGEIALTASRALAGQPAISDVFASGNGEPSVAFALPLYAIQAEGSAKAIGAVIGVRPVTGQLASLLKQPGETAASAESYLIRAQGAAIDYLSPLADGTPPLKRSLARSTAGLVDVRALERPGDFSEGRDYAGTDVLAVSRAVPGTAWVLMRNVARSEALGPTETRLRTILIVFLLVVAGVSVGLVAVWRHGASVRTAEAAEKHRIASERFESLTRFMRTVTDSQPTEIACVNASGAITFANRPLASHYGIPIMDIKNKPMVSVLGPAIAKILADVNKRVAETETNEHHLHRIEESDGLRELSTDHVYIPGNSAHPPSTLMVFHDVTSLGRERARSEQRLRQLVNTLVGVIDRRDPYSANHSSRVAEVGAAIAEEMGLSETLVSTVDLAGRLMNLGKIVIPSALLTKVGNLAPEEKDLLARSFVISGDLLSAVEFDGPVVDTIRQIGESVDGSGPLGLKSGEILVTAQVISVANMFVGMISPRAWREAMTFEKVVGDLQSMIGKRFDRQPVSALINFLDNRGGVQKWAYFRDMPTTEQE